MYHRRWAPGGASAAGGGVAADIAGATDASDEADKAHEPGPWPRPAKRHPDPAPVALRLHETTAMSPLQYQKRLRRYEARSLLLRGSRDLGMVAASVGYDKLSQFHREYQRQFGLTPLQDARRLRAAR
ncbi:helix-turn-helix domain-containing protein [Burkholderia gladioli]|uniref:helix-turn-helix domain-containing protein n=1 Tax=Burkholderia gladioli TaxID=28095 RepID=UPI003C7A05C7